MHMNEEQANTLVELCGQYPWLVELLREEQAAVLLIGFIIDHFPEYLSRDKAADLLAHAFAHVAESTPTQQALKNDEVRDMINHVLTFSGHYHVAGHTSTDIMLEKIMEGTTHD